MEGETRRGEGEGAFPGLPRCAWHPGEPATALCVSCGRPACARCARLISGRHFCPACAPAAVPPSLAANPGFGAALPRGYGGRWGAPCGGVTPEATVAPEPAGESERRWWRADWGLGEVMATWLAIFGIYSVLGVVLMLSTDNPLFYSHLAYAIFLCPLIAISVALITRRHGRGREELGLRWGNPARTISFGGLGALAAVGMSYAAFFLVYFAFYLLAGRTPVSAESEQLRGLGGGHLALTLLVTVVLAPVFEELFFRGLFYPTLRKRVGVWGAIVLNGVIFGALHMQPIFMLSLVLVGMALAFLYEKTESLAAPMLAHSMYNLAVVLIAVLTGG